MSVMNVMFGRENTRSTCHTRYTGALWSQGSVQVAWALGARSREAGVTFKNPSLEVDMFFCFFNSSTTDQ